MNAAARIFPVSTIYQNFSNKTAICHYYHIFPITLCILTKEKVLTYALAYAILVSERKRTNGGQRQRISKLSKKSLDKLNSICYNQDVNRSKQEIKSKKNKKRLDKLKKMCYNKGTKQDEP